MREQHDPVRLIVQLSAIALLLATIALSIASLRDLTGASERASIAGLQANGDDRQLARCRSITAEQLSLDEACRRAWADSRRRFLGLEQEAGNALTNKTPTTPSQSSQDNGKADAIRPSGSAVQED